MLKFASICPHPPLLIPSIGQNNLSKVNSTIEAMNRLGHEISKLDIDTIVIISPHGPVQTNLMAINGSEDLRGNFLQFGDETFMEFKNNLDLGLNIKKIADQKNIPAEMINSNIPLDHGTMVPLYFLTKNNPKIKIVPMSFSYLDYQKHFELGRIIYEAAESINEKIALVASGDLSHRLTPDAPAGYSPQGKEFDKLLIKLLESNDSVEILNMDSDLIEEAGECGLRSIIILLGALSNLEYKFEKLSYEGPFGVGYLVGRFEF
jgi:aromatic ring-opening dioxygenase LigB subunit